MNVMDVAAEAGVPRFAFISGGDVRGARERETDGRREGASRGGGVLCIETQTGLQTATARYAGIPGAAEGGGARLRRQGRKEPAEVPPTASPSQHPAHSPTHQPTSSPTHPPTPCPLTNSARLQVPRWLARPGLPAAGVLPGQERRRGAHGCGLPHGCARQCGWLGHRGAAGLGAGEGYPWRAGLLEGGHRKCCCGADAGLECSPRPAPPRRRPPRPARAPAGGVALRPGFIYGTRAVGTTQVHLGWVGAPLKAVRAFVPSVGRVRVSGRR